jgi:hypothetical protein
MLDNNPGTGMIAAGDRRPWDAATRFINCTPIRYINYTVAD